MCSDYFSSLFIASSIIEKRIQPIARKAVSDGLSLKKINPTIVAEMGSMDAIIDAFAGVSFLRPYV